MERVRASYVVKKRLQSGTKMIVLRTPAALMLGGERFDYPACAITDSVLDMLREENPGVEFVEEPNAK